MWDKIQDDHKDSELVEYPLSGFKVERWEEVHKQLLRLYFWTVLQARHTTGRFADLGIGEPAKLTAVMKDQNARWSMKALDYTNLLEEHAALLQRHQERIVGNNAQRNISSSPR